jgi:DNA-binding XRE family transcriptional regulator
VSTSGTEPLVELGHLCRQARSHSGPGGTLLNQTELGRLVGVNQVTISRLESGSTTAGKELWDSIRKHLRLTEDESEHMESLRVLGEVGQPGRIRPAAVADYVRKLVQREQVAAEILCVHELRVPGPLQSNHFSYALLGSAGRVDVAPAARMRRQRRKLFESEHLRRYDCVLYEEAFHVSARLLGDGVVLDQIEFLLDLLRGRSDDPVLDDRTTIRLLARQGTMPYLSGDATILRFDGPELDLLYIEHPGGGDYHRAREKLRRAAARRDALLPHVLDTDDSIALLDRLRAEYEDRVRRFGP